jgi:hypothetical protein
MSQKQRSIFAIQRYKLKNLLQSKLPHHSRRVVSNTCSQLPAVHLLTLDGYTTSAFRSITSNAHNIMNYYLLLLLSKWHKRFSQHHKLMNK